LLESSVESGPIPAGSHPGELAERDDGLAGLVLYVVTT